MPQVAFSKIQNGNKDLQLIQDNVQKAVTQVQSYDADTAQWAAPIPTTIQDALDRMAALLVSLHGGKIP